MDFSDYREIEIRPDGEILWLTLNRPKTLNAISERLHRELSTVFVDAGKDPASSVIVLTGAGRAFSAGGDLEWMRALADDSTLHASLARETRQIILGLLDLSKPTISRINGPAMGLGATMALLCDITIMAQSARIADPHVRVGLVAGDGGALAWPLAVGYARAKDYLLTGRSLDGSEAERIGLVSRCVPDNRLDAEVEKVASRLAEGAQMALRGTKRLLNMALRREAQAILDAGLAYEMPTMLSSDHREAIDAFAENRDPDFKSK